MPTEATFGGVRAAPPNVLHLQQRIATLAEQPIGELREAWSEAWGTVPPKGARRRLLMLGIAWHWQAEHCGGPSRQLQRQLAALEAAFRNGDTVARAPKPARTPRLLPGARLVRVWKDERHEVIITEAGFVWRGRTWTSLSAIARAITGSRRNGPAFFGLRAVAAG